MSLDGKGSGKPSYSLIQAIESGAAISPYRNCPREVPTTGIRPADTIGLSSKGAFDFSIELDRYKLENSTAPCQQALDM
jgi:hypothetical protein